MIHGCATNDSVNIGASITTDTSPIKCPAISRSDRAEARRAVKAPAPDAKRNGADAYSVAALQSWIDQYEISETRKNRVIRRVVFEHDKCRGQQEKIAAGTS
jgi:hypothetical protein